MDIPKTSETKKTRKFLILNEKIKVLPKIPTQNIVPEILPKWFLNKKDLIKIKNNKHRKVITADPDQKFDVSDWI